MFQYLSGVVKDLHKQPDKFNVVHTKLTTSQRILPT